MRWRWKRAALRWSRRVCTRTRARRRCSNWRWRHSAWRRHRHTRRHHSRPRCKRRRRTRREWWRGASQMDWCTTRRKWWRLEHARWRRERRRKRCWSSKHRCSRRCNRRHVVASHECLVGRKLSCEFRVCWLPIVHLGSFGWRLANRARCETEFFFFSSFVGCHVGRGDAFHSEDFDLRENEEYVIIVLLHAVSSPSTS